jgi:hypothetical protein
MYIDIKASDVQLTIYAALSDSSKRFSCAENFSSQKPRIFSSLLLFSGHKILRENARLTFLVACNVEHLLTPQETRRNCAIADDYFRKHERWRHIIKEEVTKNSKLNLSSRNNDTNNADTYKKWETGKGQ